MKVMGRSRTMKETAGWRRGRSHTTERQGGRGIRVNLLGWGASHIYRNNNHSAPETGNVVRVKQKTHGLTGSEVIIQKIQDLSPIEDTEESLS